MNGVWSLSPAIKRTLWSCTSGVHFIEIPLCLLKRYVEFNQRYYVGGGGLEGGVHENEQGWTRGEGGQNLAILRDRTFWMSPRHIYTIPYKYIYIYIYCMVYGMYIVYIYMVYIWHIYKLYCYNFHKALSFTPNRLFSSF